MQKNEHRTKVTLTLIKNAFADLLTEVNVNKISVKMLCEKAEISRGTFYRHFVDIIELLESIKVEMIENLSKSLTPMLTKNSPLIETLENIFTYLKDNRDICSLTLGKNSDRHFTSQLMQMGKEHCLKLYSNGSSENFKKLENYYTYASAGCIGLLENWVNDSMVMSPKELAQIAEKLFIGGISYLYN